MDPILFKFLQLAFIFVAVKYTSQSVEDVLKANKEAKKPFTIGQFWAITFIVAIKIVVSLYLFDWVFQAPEP